MKNTFVVALALASLFLGAPAFAAEPSLHEVYQAAGGGHLADAERMMGTVLQAHPNSGKAHYVEAELQAKAGHLKQAAAQLAIAERLAPGLPFASRQAVADLQRLVGPGAPAALPFAAAPAVRPTAPAAFPWGMVLAGLGLVVFIVWASRFMARANAGRGNGGTSIVGANVPSYPGASYGGAAPGYGAGAGAPGSGLGAQMLGGLATGAAVGAGVVAGEALLHHFLDGRAATPASDPAYSSFDSIPDLPSTPFDDMGGNDFGIADGASWDDGGTSGDSDWN